MRIVLPSSVPMLMLGNRSRVASWACGICEMSNGCNPGTSDVKPFSVAMTAGNPAIMPCTFGRGSVARAHVVYWVYVALWGIGIAPIVNRYLGVDPSMVMTAFLSASATFGAMSVWGYTSKRDLSGMANIAAMALMGLLIAAVINLVVAMFTGIGGTAMVISTLISAGFVLFVSLITAWETQAIKEMYVESEGGEAVAKKSIFGAFMLYGSFISIFVNILQILGFMSSSSE